MERGRKKEKKKCFPGEIAGLATQKLISNIMFGFTVIFTFIHSKCSMQASNFSFGRRWGRGGRGRRKKCFPGRIAGLAAQKLISNITFGFTVIFTFIHLKLSLIHI